MEPLSIGYYFGWAIKRLVGDDPAGLKLRLYSTIKRSSDVRVSVSTILRLMDGDRYVLIRNDHRPEVFGPIGGVVKFDHAAKPHLDNFEFRPQHELDPTDMARDLRGFLPRRGLGAFRAWALASDHKEDDQSCIKREMREELGARLKPTDIQNLNVARFRRVRSVGEGPTKAIGREYVQYRIFNVVELAESDQKSRRLSRRIRELVATNQDLIAATAAEIKIGRTESRQLIGQHAAYLFGSKVLRPESPF